MKRLRHAMGTHDEALWVIWGSRLACHFIGYTPR